MTEKAPGSDPTLGQIHLVNFGAHASHTGIASDIPGVNIAAERVAGAIVTSLFREDIDHMRRKVEAYDEPELAGTPFFVPEIGAKLSRARDRENLRDLHAAKIRRLRSARQITRRANQFRFAESMSSPEIKNISLFQKPNQGYIFGHPVLLRRASAVVTDVGRVAVDADVAET